MKKRGKKSKSKEKIKVIKVRNDYTFSVGNPFVVLLSSIILILAILLVVNMVNQNEIKLAPLVNGLVAYWSFNNVNYQDESGLGHSTSCSLMSGKCPSFTNGLHKKSLSFDGINDFIQVADKEDLKVKDEFTFSAWIKPKDNGNNYILTKDYVGSDVTGGFIFLVNYRIQFEINNKNVVLGSNNIIQSNKWQHVAIVHSGNLYKFYYNGQLINTITNTNDPSQISAPVLIGRRGYDENFNFNGDIDEIRIYNRALGDSEISKLRNFDCSVFDDTNSQPFYLAWNNEVLWNVVHGGYEERHILCMENQWIEEGTNNDWEFADDVSICSQKGNFYVDEPNGVWKTGTVAGNKMSLGMDIPPQFIELPDYHSASGLTYNTETQTLFWVDDDKRRIIEIDKEGKFIPSRTIISVSGADKLEGIAHIRLNEYAIVDEDAKKLSLHQIVGSATNSIGSFSNFPGVGGNDGLEGVAYHKERDSYYVVKEKLPKKLYELKRNGNNFVVLKEYNHDNSRDYAAVDINPINGNVMVLNEDDGLDNIEEPDRIYEINPETGIVIETYNFPINLVSPEGIAFDNNYLYVVGEGGRIPAQNNPLSQSQFARYKINWCSA